MLSTISMFVTAKTKNFNFALRKKYEQRFKMFALMKQSSFEKMKNYAVFNVNS